jgi:hypothetical protein
MNPVALDDTPACEQIIQLMETAGIDTFRFINIHEPEI